jgi:hypothetical protein
MVYAIHGGGGGLVGSTALVSQVFALLHCSANQVFLDNTSDAISWTSAFDDNTTSVWNSSPNPTRVVVPSGMTVVTLTANVQWVLTPTEGNRSVRIDMNGSSFVGQPLVRVSNATLEMINLATPPVSVVAGDYFEVILLQETASSIQVLGTENTWMAMQGKIITET